MLAQRSYKFCTDGFRFRYVLHSGLLTRVLKENCSFRAGRSVPAKWKSSRRTPGEPGRHQPGRLVLKNDVLVSLRWQSLRGYAHLHLESRYLDLSHRPDCRLIIRLFCSGTSDSSPQSPFTICQCGHARVTVSLCSNPATVDSIRPSVESRWHAPTSEATDTL